MFTNILICLGLLAVAGLCIWLARRALHLRNPFARWALAIVASLPALLLILATGLISYGYYSLYRPRSAPAIQLDTAASPARLARGEHLARSTCVACHTTSGELPLSGGFDLSVDSPGNWTQEIYLRKDATKASWVGEAWRPIRSAVCAASDADYAAARDRARTIRS